MLKRLLTFCAAAITSLLSMAAVVEDFNKDWSSETGYPYYKVDDKATYEITDGALKVTYPLNEDGTPAWSQYFIGDWLNTTNGYTYTIKFQARAAQATSVDVILGTWGGSGSAKGIAIGTEWTEVSCEIKDGVPTSTGDVHILIQGGQNAGSIEYKLVTVSHDDAEKLPEPEPEPDPFVVPAGEIDFTTLNVVGTLIDNNIGKKLNGGGVVWGSQSDGSNYTDVTAYKSVKFYGTPGAALRLFVNRIGGDGVNVGTTEQRVKLNEEGVAEMNVAEVMTALGSDHCYLSSVKIAAAWQVEGAVESNVTIEGITVVPAATPSEPALLPMEYEYAEGNTSVTFSVKPTAEGSQILYFFGDNEEPMGEVENGKVTIAPAPGQFDESGIAHFLVTFREYGAEMNLLAENGVEVDLYKTVGVPELVMDYEYAEGNTSVTFTVQPTAEGSTILYFFGDNEEPMGEVVDGKVTIAPAPGQFDESGIAHFLVTFREYDAEMNLLAENGVEVDLYKTVGVPELVMDYEYAEGNTSVTFTVQPTAEGSTILYFFGDNEEPMGEVVDGKVTIAPAPGQFDESGIAHFLVTFREYDAEMNLLAENGVEVDLYKTVGVPELVMDYEYGEGNSYVTFTVQPTTEGSQILYFFNDDEEPMGMVENGKVTIAPAPGQFDESGIAHFLVIFREYDAEMNLLAENGVEVDLYKQIEPEETDLIEIAQDQGTQYDDFARAELVEGEEYNTYTVTQDLQIAFKMMDIDVKDCDYVIVKFAEPVAAGWKLAFWANQDLTDVPEGATEFKYELPADVLASGVLPQITMMTFFGGYTAPLVAKVSGVYKHSTGAAVGIDGIAAQKAAGIYTITGAKVNKLQKGINIVIDENGVAKKVIRK